MSADLPGRLPPAFMTTGTSSFVEFLASHAPHLLPGAGPEAAGLAAHAGQPGRDGQVAPHATTIVAAAFDGGVVMAGDRRATMGSHIASHHIEKVFAVDDACVVGIAGTAGIAIELVRLFQLEIEHYEKTEGISLSIEGKANRLATMIRSNLALALQGLAVVPLLAGFDAGSGRIFSYDVTGGRYEEREFHAVGSGAVYARGSLKKRWNPGLDARGAVRVAVEALVDAADDDSATGGPDAVRRIFPVVTVVDAGGVRRVDDAELAEVVGEIVTDRVRSQAATGKGVQR